VTAAFLSGPDGVTVTANGTLSIADTDDSRIRRVSKSGTITTVPASPAVSRSGQPSNWAASFLGALRRQASVNSSRRSARSARATTTTTHANRAPQ